MPIATKNNQIIVKDGKLAESCQCCGGPCSRTSVKLRVTLNNLPGDCFRQNEYMSQYVTRDLPLLNGCSFNVFRVNKGNGNSQPPNCEYLAILPGLHNYYLYCGDSSWKVYVRLLLDYDALSFQFFNYYVVLLPEQGKTFRTLPYSGGVVVGYNGGSNCTSQQWGGVTVSIDEGEPTFRPLSCPDKTACDSASDIQPTPPGSSFVDIATCDLCSPDRVAFIDHTQFPTPPWVPGVDDLHVALNISQISIDDHGGVYATNPPESIGGFASMSGTYALRYSTRGYDVPAFGLRPSQADMVGCGWTGTFYSTPYGQADTGKGYEMLQLDALGSGGWQPVRMMAALEISVVPLGWHIPYNATTNTYSSVPCSGDTVAYQIRMTLYRGLINMDSGFGYYKAFNYWYSYAYYESVACQQRKCRGVPSFSFNQTSYGQHAIYVGGSFYSLLSHFDFSVSTQ